MPKPPTDAELAVLDAQEQNATPGPWEALYFPMAGHATPANHVDLVADDGTSLLSLAGEGRRLGPTLDLDDAIFIAAARNSIPALLAEVRRLRAELDATIASHQKMNGRYEAATDLLLDLQGSGEYTLEAGRARISAFMDSV